MNHPSIQRLKLTNGLIITPFRTLRDSCVLIEAGKIVDICPAATGFPDAVEIDADGHYIVPGFIDLHVHGGGGYDFMDGTPEAFLNIAALHAQHGTTALVPTTLTGTLSGLLHILDCYHQASRQAHAGAQFLGMHLEGPYFALSQRGAQDPRYIRDPEPAEYEAVLAHSSAISRWSVAPERSGALALGRLLHRKGILAAIAHTDAVYDEVLAAVRNGYSLVTHLYSAMSGVTRRNGFRFPGVIESAYLLDELDVELIADGVHLPGPLLRLAHKIKGPDKTALITDAMRAAGLPPGPSILGSLRDGLPVIVEDGVAKLPDRQAFAGSVATADRLLRTVMTQTDIPLTDALQMMTSTPARIMGVGNRKGTLTPGYDADLVIMDRQYNVRLTIVNGRIVYQHDKTLVSS